MRHSAAREPEEPAIDPVFPDRCAEKQKPRLNERRRALRRLADLHRCSPTSTSKAIELWTTALGLYLPA